MLLDYLRTSPLFQLRSALKALLPEPVFNTLKQCKNQLLKTGTVTLIHKNPNALSSSTPPPGYEIRPLH
jgi:hypothetical protein